MFSRASTRSRPRLDMEVATTRSPLSLFWDLRKRAAARRTPSPLTIFPVSQTKSARSASPSKATPRCAFSATTRFCKPSRCSEPQPALMLRPSGETPMAITSAPSERNNSGPSLNAAETVELRAGNEALPEKGEIFRVKGFIGGERCRILWRGFAPVLQDARFQLFLEGVREFHPGVRKQLHAVVLKGIVRGGDDHAGLKIILANKARHAGSGNHAGKSDSGASPRETRSK